MNIFDALTNKEKEMIEDYISFYAGSRNGVAAGLDYILRYWNAQKEKLYHIFGDNFILEKEIKVEKDVHHLERDIDSLLYDRTKDPGYYDRFWQAIRAIEKYYEDKGDVAGQPWPNEEYWVFKRLYSERCLSKNAWDYDPATIEINGKEVKIQAGAKPMRILQKIFNAHGYGSVFEEFRIKHSLVFNEKLLSGTLCLSIHPLDYMTMSDNDCNWDSCMNWRHEGSYRRGTVEMMNSDCMVVAYLKSTDGSLDFGRHSWNSKKWRELIICQPDGDFICGVKGYPMWNKNLEEAAVAWLKELMEQAGNEYGPIDTIYPWSNTYCYNDIEVYFDPDCDTMYNDFNDEVGHTGCFGVDTMENLKEHCQYHYNYSGDANCMTCGCDLYYEESEEWMLVCENCNGAIRCHDCGEYIDEDRAIWVDDEPLCEYCYDDATFIDPLTDETHLWSNHQKLRIMNKEEKLIYNCSINIFDDTLYDSKILKDAFGENVKKYNVNCSNRGWIWGEWRYCIDIADIDPERMEYVEDLFELDLEDYTTYDKFEARLYR